MKFQPGDKVKCVSKTYTPWAENLSFIEVGGIYTVNIVDRISSYRQTDKVITLTEVDKLWTDQPFFDERDFVKAGDATVGLDVEDAWNRAMGLL